MLEICNQQITQKGDGVKLSFCIFFKNKNDNPQNLMGVADNKTHIKSL
jgi:hypothetical protein